MAEIVFGAGTSHSPLLAAPPKYWAERADQDRYNPELYDNTGVIRPFDDLVAAANGKFDAASKPEVWEENWQRCETALDRLRDDFRRVAPDVVLVIGDDQRELFEASNQPVMAISAASEMQTGVLDGPDSEFFNEVAAGYLMDQQFTFAGHSKLAEDLVRGLMTEGMDVTWMEAAPDGKGFGHAYGFPIHRFFLPEPIPVIPFMLNTYYPPNQPTPRRCFELGRALRKAAAASPVEARIAILASGGLSHFVVNEELDRKMLDAIHANDSEALCELPVEQLDSGSSEIRNWITAAGAMEGCRVDWSEYVPIVRTPAGTGCGMGFLSWAW
ncbi:DODA-type extradiol aromatic ring-opening family dioxygenase [Amycolatopsis japonica]